jgi:phospholipid/cholesterol/gamma-HCH transport system ATP-binding protein
MTALTVDDEIIKLRDLEQVTSVLVTHQLRDAFYVSTQEARKRPDGSVEIGAAAHDKIEQADFVMIKEGQVAFEGTAEELRRSQDSYLQTFLS